MLKIISFLLLLASADAQSAYPTDNFKPYLIENNKIVGANTASLNKDSGQTRVDTIYYWLEVIDTTVGVWFGNGVNQKYYRPILGMKAVGLWTEDKYIGNHWDLFDDKYHLIRNKKEILIVKIIEVNAK